MRQLFLLLLSTFVLQSAYAQLTGVGHTGIIPTAYTDGRSPDNIYVFCGDAIGQHNGKLTATAPITGTGPFTFKWSFYNEGSNSWSLLSSETGSNSTIDNLPSDGYRVIISDVNDVNIACHYAWVWNMNMKITAANTRTACNATNLNATIQSESTFSYFNIPPDESLIKSDTQISVCFSATHTYISDLAFYLKAPNGATIILSPNPAAVGQDRICNSRDNVSNLCFTNTSQSILNICTQPSPMSGSYGRYYNSNGNGTPIDWSPLIGQNAAQSGWAVQIYDCIGGDRGSLTNASISFSNLDNSGGCNALTDITYNSGSINSAINDNSCTASSASIFAVPISPLLTTPITLTASITSFWSANKPIPAWAANNNIYNGTNVSVENIPSGTTAFTFNAIISSGGVSCVDQNAVTTFKNECCTAAVNINAPSITMCPNTPTKITSQVLGNRYEWSPTTGLDDFTSAEPTLSLTNLTDSIVDHWYYLTVFDDPNECEEIDSILIRVIGQPRVSVPDFSCMSVDYNIFSTSYKGGTWELLSTTPSNLNIDSFLYLMPMDYDTMGIRVGVEGKYTMQFTDSVCGLKATGTLDFKPYIWTEIKDTSICVNSTFLLKSWTPPSPVKYLWSTGSTQPNIEISEIGTYSLTISNECFEFTDYAVITNKICDIEAPNIISLSSTVGNDKWFVKEVGVKEFNCYIVDRWGNVIYQFDEVSGFWNGRTSKGNKVSEGVYFYTIKAKSEGDQEILKQGFIEVKH